MSKTLEEVFAEFKQLPDWNRFPMPDVFYTYFNVQKPKPAEIMETLTYQPPPSDSQRSVEKRPPAPGGVREVPTLAPLTINTELIPDENDDEYQQETQTQSACSTEPSEPKNQELVCHSLPNLLEHDASQDTKLSAPPPDAS